MYKMENNSIMKNCTKIRLLASPSFISETGLGELSLSVIPRLLGLRLYLLISLFILPSSFLLKILAIIIKHQFDEIILNI